MAATANNDPVFYAPGPNLVLDILDLGPIAEARDIEFKPMTVFVGPGNTGKTYLATVLHAITQARHRTSALATFADQFQGSGGHPSLDSRSGILRNEIYPAIAESLNQSEIQDGFVTKRFQVSDLSSDSRGLLLDATRIYLASYLVEAQRTIADYFNVADFDDLLRRHDDVDMPPTVNVRNADLTIALSVNRASVDRLDLPRELTIHFDLDPAALRQMTQSLEFTLDVDLLFEIGHFSESIIHHFPRSRHLQAGRTGLIDAYRELAATLIQRAATRSRDGEDCNQLSVSLMTSEFLQYLVRVSSALERQRRNSPMAKLADLIENRVLGGTINIKETAGVTYFEFEKNGVSVPLDQASSMATELAPIILLLRCFIDIGDLLIIDEPEAHLHPEAQQQMAAALAFMVRSGLRVLITTHSHYMVEQLSAFVNASKLNETTRKRALSLGGALGKEDIYLNEDETAVYSFKMSPEHGGSVVEEIFMGEEFEYGSDDHSDAVTDQFNRSQRVLEAREKVEFGELG